MSPAKVRSTHYCMLPKYRYLDIVGVEAVAVLSERVRKFNIQTWSRIDEEVWPPGPTKTFTPLILIQHQGQRNLKQSTAMAKFIERGYIDKIVTGITEVPKHHHKLDGHELLEEVLDTSKISKEVTDVLAPMEISNDPHFILIEGAPGIGKSFLLKELAYRWGTKQILQKFKLVLLICLRNPAIQQMSSIDDLLRSFCKGDRRATEIACACSDYLLMNGGEDLAFLLDGYDEYPEILRKESLIAYILKRETLPHCSLIVSSRPHISLCLHKQATVRVDILGFAEAEREHYIKESMKGQLQKIDELLWYLQGHSTISSLCFVPFNITALVYLYKQGIPPPKNSAELYNYFIFLTICRHLAKHGQNLQGNISELTNLPKLTNLPEPYNRIVKQLSKLSLGALNDGKLIFTFDKIKEICPDITTIPEASNGFGLLQVVEHFGLTGTISTFNFLHFSVQEYLAAYYVASLPAEEELQIIKKYFWNDLHFNMFSMYVTLTKGQRPSFKQFLCDGNKEIAISDKFLNDQLQCVRLYRCFYEASDVDICRIIEESAQFCKKEIDLSDTTLTAHDVGCVTSFLTSSFHKQWVQLNLCRCYIQDSGLHILHHGLLHCSDITIGMLGLWHNGLTTLSTSFISEITVKCRVKKLAINGNPTIGENEQLYDMLTSPSIMLEELHMYYTELSSKGASALFKSLEDNNTLKELYIFNNNVTDDACDTIATALERNSSLVTLSVYNNPVTGEGMVNIVNGLKVNNTLAVLELPECLKNSKKKISSLQEAINKKRKIKDVK